MESRLRTLLPALLQVSGIVSFTWAIDYQMNRVQFPEDFPGSAFRKGFGGVAKYLTFLNMVLQLVFFIIAFLANFIKSLRGIRDIVFASAAFPIGMFVGIIFWSIWAVDRELIFPRILDDYFPALVNHCMHTTVIPLQLGQLLLVKHNFPSKKTGFIITALLCAGYLVWINYIYYVTGKWVYPVIKVLTYEQRIGFFVGCSVLGGCLYFTGVFLNYIIWGSKQQQSAQGNKKLKKKQK